MFFFMTRCIYFIFYFIFDEIYWSGTNAVLYVIQTGHAVSWNQIGNALLCGIDVTLYSGQRTYVGP